MIQITVSMPRLFTEGAGTLDLDLTLATGSLTAIVGPSGSGKTTLLRLLAGLETPRQGRIMVDERVWFDGELGISLVPQQRSIGYVFQDTALFPNLSVRENIAYAAPAGQRALINELIDATGLGSFVDKKPTVLSGGQRQRVALARALVRRPKLLLLDEPFAALDAASSARLRLVLLDLHRAWGTTTLLVSHHDADVRALADRVIHVVQGRIQSDQMWASEAAQANERINRIQFDEASQQWVIDTDTVQVRSADVAWGRLNAGDFIQITGHPLPKQP